MSIVKALFVMVEVLVACYCAYRLGDAHGFIEAMSLWDKQMKEIDKEMNKLLEKIGGKK